MKRALRVILVVGLVLGLGAVVKAGSDSSIVTDECGSHTLSGYTTIDFYSSTENVVWSTRSSTSSDHDDPPAEVSVTWYVWRDSEFVDDGAAFAQSYPPDLVVWGVTDGGSCPEYLGGCEYEIYAEHAAMWDPNMYDPAVNLGTVTRAFCEVPLSAAWTATDAMQASSAPWGHIDSKEALGIYYETLSDTRGLRHLPVMTVWEARQARVGKMGASLGQMLVKHVFPQFLRTGDLMPPAFRLGEDSLVLLFCHRDGTVDSVRLEWIGGRWLARLW